MREAYGSWPRFVAAGPRQWHRPLWRRRRGASRSRRPGRRLRATRPIRAPTAKAAPQSLRVYLAPNGGEDALKAAVDAVSTPGSPTYGQFLTPDQFRANYAPTDATIKAVKQWLKAAGSEGRGRRGLGPLHRRHRHRGRRRGRVRDHAARLHQGRRDVPGADGDADRAGRDRGRRRSPSPGLATAEGVMKPLQQSFPPPPAFVNARPCSATLRLDAGQVPGGLQDAAAGLQRRHAARTRPAATSPRSCAAPMRAARRTRARGVTVAIADAYASPTIGTTPTPTPPATGTPVPRGQLPQVLCRGLHAHRRLRRVRLVRRGDSRRRGRARRRPRLRHRVRRRRLLLRPDLPTRSTRSSTSTSPRSSPTPGATSRPTRRRTSPPTTSSSRRERCGHRLLLLLRRHRRRRRDRHEAGRRSRDSARG